MSESLFNSKLLGRVGVLMGGVSSEREISLKSGKAVFEALQTVGCDVVAVEIDTTDPKEILKRLGDLRVDIVFVVLHGKFGEDGQIQTILEKAGIAYTGSGPVASRLAMDKSATQLFLKKQGIKVPDFFILDKDQEHLALKFLDDLGGCPVVVKPSCEGSSIGISIVHQVENFLPAVRRAFEFGPRVLVDQYIRGKEITSGVLGTKALSLVEIRSKNNFFDFTAKYQKGMSRYIVPAEIDLAQARNIQETSEKIFNLVGCRDLARADFILDEEGGVYFLEINTIPGFTSTSLLPMAAHDQGLSFSQLCLKITSFAARRKQEASLI